MIATFTSLLLCMLLVAGAAAHVNKVYSIFLDPVGLALVLGGTLGVALLTFGPREALHLSRTTFRVLRQKLEEPSQLAREIIILARDTRCEVIELQNKLPQIKNPFLRDGIALVCDRIEEQKIEQILRDRIKVKQESDDSTANMLRTLAKYPPSFGIIGTVLGLIALMMQLGTAGGTEKMGPAMAVGLVATLYGLVLTNFVLQPMSENLSLRSHKDIRKRQMAMVGVLLIKQNERPVVIQEAINSLLPVAQRVDELGLGDQRKVEEAA